MQKFSIPKLDIKEIIIQNPFFKTIVLFAIHTGYYLFYIKSHVNISFKMLHIQPNVLNFTLIDEIFCKK